MRALLLVAAAVLGGCYPPFSPTFVCSSDVQCTRGSVAGSCDPAGACVHAQAGCSGGVYDPSAGPALAGLCAGSCSTPGAESPYQAGASHIATSMRTPTDKLAVDGTSLFWVQNEQPDAVLVAPLVNPGTGQPTVRTFLAQRTALALAVDATNLYWLQAGDGGVGGELWASDKATDTPRRVARFASAPLPRILVVDGDSVLFASQLGSQGVALHRALSAGADTQAVVPLAVADKVTALASGGGYLYWVGGGALWRVPGTGGAAERLAPSGVADVVAADCAFVYYGGAGAILSRRSHARPGGARATAAGSSCAVGIIAEPNGVFCAGATSVTRYGRDLAASGASLVPKPAPVSVMAAWTDHLAFVSNVDGWLLYALPTTP